MTTSRAKAPARRPTPSGAAKEQNAPKKQNKYSTPAVEKAFAVLELISRRDEGARMVDVVDTLDLPKSSAFVLLTSLEQLGYLTRDSAGRYRLTSRMFELGMRAMRNLDVAEVSMPHLETLRDTTGMTVHLAGRDHSSVVYLRKLDGRGFVRFDTYVGKRSALHLTGVGKALAAFLPEDEIERVADGLDFGAGTSKSIQSARAFKANLKRVRERGYALDDEEEEPGVRCVAAPIRNHRGDVVASAGVVGLARDLTGGAALDRVAAAVVETTRAISLQLGSPAEA